MRHTVITSFSPSGYARYGRDFLTSFAEHWPESVGCVVYYEQLPDEVREERLPKAVADRITWRSAQLVTGLYPFLRAVEHFPLLRGEQNGQYNIQTDARMARKAFMECYAAEDIGGKVFWIDADVVTHSKVPEGTLDMLLPDEKLCCFLGRGDIYTESGFLGFNADHTVCGPFLRIYRSIFESGTFLTMPAWHDCVAFDAARRSFDEHRPNLFVNLGQGVNAGPNYHVFINSVLGKWMDHKKGPRKDMTRSPDSDLTAPRNEPYWRSEPGPKNEAG